MGSAYAQGMATDTPDHPFIQAGRAGKSLIDARDLSFTQLMGDSASIVYTPQDKSLLNLASVQPFLEASPARFGKAQQFSGALLVGFASS